VSSNRDRQAIEAKLAAYLTVLEHRLYETHLGLPNLTILFKRMTAEPKPTRPAKKRRRRPPKEFVDYVLEIDGWDWGYALDKDTFIEVSKEELEEIALESTRTIEIDEFVDRGDIDPRYLIRPYYLRPDGKVGHDAFAVRRSSASKPSSMLHWMRWNTTLIGKSWSA
jgi:hypothetical protein